MRASDPAKQVDLAVGPLPGLIRCGGQSDKIVTANQQLCSDVATATASRKSEHTGIVGSEHEQSAQIVLGKHQDQL